MIQPQLDDLLELRHMAHTLGLASHHLVNSSFSGLYASVFRGQGLNFEEVREYREGDDIRNMDWKVTARTGSAHLKIFREERERSVMLCVDKGPHMAFGTRRTFKASQAARAAALLGWAANGLHDRVGGLLFGDDQLDHSHFRPTKDRRALWRLLKATTLQTKNQQESEPGLMAEALKQVARGASTGGLVFLIADFNRSLSGLDKSLAMLVQHHSIVLVPVDDPADQQLPDMGQTLFRGPDGSVLSIDTSSQEARDHYAAQWQQRRKALIRLANSMGIAVIPISTTEDVHWSLKRGLEQRARLRAFL